MEMEVIVPTKIDFDFNEARSSSPYLTAAPSTPRPFGDYYHSVPSSPSRLSAFYRDFEDDFLAVSYGDAKPSGKPGRSPLNVTVSVPFEWEEKPGTPKSGKLSRVDYEDEFAFEFSQEMERTSSSADELFDGGVIRPLKPPPRLQSPPISPKGQRKSFISEIYSPKKGKVTNSVSGGKRTTERERERGRGRDSSSLPSSGSGRKATRSLSPLRVSEYPWEEEERQLLQENTKQLSPMPSMPSKPSKPSLTSTTSALSTNNSKGHRKWRLKDFFLFRSASEGRATGNKDPLKKYASLFKRHDDVKQHSSFRQIDSPGSGSNSSRRGPISAHELHYTMNRAVSEDLKKKTFLPYKQGILGRLAFNPAVHALANGFGFSRQ